MQISEKCDKAALPPGPDSACDLERAEDKLDRMQDLWQRYGDCYRVRGETRNADIYVINRPDWIKQVLVSNHRNYTKGLGIERVRVLLGSGIMTSEGERWRRQRRMLQPAFQKARIESFFNVFFQQAAQLAGQWEALARRDEAVNITEAASRTTLQAVLETIFSEDLVRMQHERGLNPFALVGEQKQRDLQFAVKFRALGHLVQQVVEWRRQQKRYPPDLLSHCIQVLDKTSGEPMSDRQRVDEILTLIVAGHETTAASLNWVWYLLACHPDVYTRVSEEACALALDATPNWKVLESMVWIPRVIKESLRLYPPGWLYTRRAIAEDRFGDYRIPPGSDVFICSYLLHRHPDWWEHAERFLPERFAPRQEAERHPFAYIPFSAGARNCIGERFAMAEMMIHVAVLAARFVPEFFERSSTPELEAGVNLRPRRDLYLKLIPLDPDTGARRP